MSIFILRKLFLFCLLLGTVIAMSCNRVAPSHADNVIARVGQQYLTMEEARKDIPDFVLKQDSINALVRYREEWVKKQVLLQEAGRLGLAQKEEVQKRLQQARQEVLRDALKDYVIGSNQEKITVTDNEARTYYQAHKEQFVLDEKFVKFRHIQTHTNREAQAARQDLLDGVPWPEVARKYSMRPNDAIYDSEQYWPISMAVSNIDIMHRYLNVIGQSEISPIQRVNGVYHFVQLMDTRAKGEHPDLEWLIEQIKHWMKLNKRRRSFSSYVQNLYLKAKSNNEVELFNVTPKQSNPNDTVKDTLESNSPNE